MYRIPTTYPAYRSETGLNGKADKRGANIMAVDHAFENYKDNFENSSADTRAGLTLALYEACESWLKLKLTKPAVTGVLFKTTNKNLTRRRKVISTVAKQCIDSLRNAHRIETTRQKFQSRKVDMLAKGTDRKQATPLSGDYGTERRTWLGSGKTVAIAGHFHASQQDLQGLALDQDNFNGMSRQEYATFLKGKSQHVLYIKKKDRLTCLVDFGDGGLARRPNGQLFDCELPAFDATQTAPFIGKLWMYAMDSYGNLFSMPVPEFDQLKDLAEALGQQRAKISNFNHSSFNAGREVICAGLIGSSDGYLRWIDNNSGHYKPTRSSLKDAVEFMADEGRNLSRLMVGAYHYLPNGNIKCIEVHSPGHYLLNVDAKGDIGTV